MFNTVDILQQQHADTVVVLEQLEKDCYNCKFDEIDHVEFANCCIELKGLRIVEEALRKRLENRGIVYDSSSKSYYAKVAVIGSYSCCKACDDSKHRDSQNEPENAGRDKTQTK